MINLKASKGQSMVETALILPLVLLILFAIFEFGRIFNADLVITNAAREGARRSAVGATDTETTNYVKSASSTLDQSHLQITIIPAGNKVQGADVTVQIDYSVQLVTPIISSLVPNPFHLTAETVMRVE